MGVQRILTTYIPQGVFVVTSKADNKINGMTAAWVSQVSFRPRLLAVSIAPQRYTYKLIKKSGIFCLNVLGQGQEALAKHFGFKSGRDVDKFKGIGIFSAFNGSPVLKDAVAYFECRVVATCETGDHVLFIGELIDHRLLKEDVPPLIFKWEDYFGGKD